MPTHLLGASIELPALLRLRAESALWRRAGGRARAAGGQQLTSRQGRGIEFEELRMYQPTDDVRSIDWRVTARKGRPHTRVYREEREQPCYFAIDLRAPMQFGSRDRFKAVAAAQLLALMAWAALADGDRIGGAVLHDDGISQVPLRRGEQAVLQLLAQVAAAHKSPAEFAPSSAFRGSANAACSLAVLLATMLMHARAGTRSVLLSDFHDLDDAGVQRLVQLARRGSTECICVFDPLEAQLPPPAQYPIDAASGDRLLLDSGNDGLRRAHAARFEARRTLLLRLVREGAIRLTELRTDTRADARMTQLNANAGAAR